MTCKSMVKQMLSLNRCAFTTVLKQPFSTSTPAFNPFRFGFKKWNIFAPKRLNWMPQNTLERKLFEEQKKNEFLTLQLLLEKSSMKILSTDMGIQMQYAAAQSAVQTIGYESCSGMAANVVKNFAKQLDLDRNQWNCFVFDTDYRTKCDFVHTSKFTDYILFSYRRFNIVLFKEH